MPDGIYNCADVEKVAGRMISRGYSDETVKKVFYGNARVFFERNGIKPL